jgi:hypothetical protein
MAKGQRVLFPQQKYKTKHKKQQKPVKNDAFKPERRFTTTQYCSGGLFAFNTTKEYG